MPYSVKDPTSVRIDDMTYLIIVYNLHDGLFNNNTPFTDSEKNSIFLKLKNQHHKLFIINQVHNISTNNKNNTAILFTVALAEDIESSFF